MKGVMPPEGTREKSRLAAGLLAFFVPGVGHLYLGYYAKGILLLGALLLDIATMIRLADSAGGRHLLLIVYLGLALPVLYFYSVFDTLQLTASPAAKSPVREERPSPATVIIQGLAVLATGALLLFIVRMPGEFIPLFDRAADYAPGIGLLIIAALLCVRPGSRVPRLGRLTSILLIVSVAVLLLWDRAQNRNDLVLLEQWWPAVFLLLGLEFVGYGVWHAYRRRPLRLSFDAAAGVLAFVIAAAAYGVTQYAALPFRWLDQWNVDISGLGDLGEEKGFRYVLPSTAKPLGPETKTIAIDNPNGEVTVLAGEGDEVRVEAVLWVDLPDKAAADAVADRSRIELAAGEEFRIEAKGELYGANGSRTPRINMKVTLPADKLNAYTNLSGHTAAGGESSAAETSEREADGLPSPEPANGPEPDETAGTDEAADEPLSEEAKPLALYVQTGSGTLSVKGLTLPGGLSARNASGEIQISQINGDVHAATKNGGITVSRVQGSAELQTANGAIAASRISGDVNASTTNGAIQLTRIDGNVAVDAKNGRIGIKEAARTVKAYTLNGSISAASSVVGGNWDIDSSVGEISLELPEDGSYSIYGSVTFGSIETELPFAVSQKTVQGAIGDGVYRINIDANNSIFIKRYIP